MNKDLMAVTQDLAKLLEKSSQVSELEKNKVKHQLSSIRSHRSSAAGLNR